MSARTKASANKRRSTDAPPGTAAFYPDVSFGPLVPATFLARPNRFLVVARVDGREVRLASRDPGRLRELLAPGASLLAAPASDPARRTAYTMTLVRRRRRWICLVPALANRVFESALRRGGVPGLAGARVLAREVAAGASRFDFMLDHQGRRVLTEVKSVTLVSRGRGLFPDAPTARGTRHLRELAAVRRAGGDALVVFLVQRGDAAAVAAHARIDPHFARALEEAAAAGVRLQAYTCAVSPAGIRLERAVPVLL